MLAKNGVTLEVTPDALKFLAKEGYNPEFGARPVKRVIQRMVLNQTVKRHPCTTRRQEKPIVIGLDCRRQSAIPKLIL